MTEGVVFRMSEAKRFGVTKRSWKGRCESKIEQPCLNYPNDRSSESRRRLFEKIHQTLRMWLTLIIVCSPFYHVLVGQPFETKYRVGNPSHTENYIF